MHGDRRPPLLLSLPAVLVAIAGMVWLRLVVYPDWVVPLTYALPLLIALWHRNRRLHWTMAAAFAVLSGLKFHLGIKDVLPEDLFWPFWGMQLANIGVAALVIDVVNVLRDRLEARNVALAMANAELEASNEELAAREEEISRQNEELEQQTEELQQQAEELQQQAEEVEAQTEELQAANEELASKEETLTSLLSLSDSSEDLAEALNRICALAPGLTGARAAAVLVPAGAFLELKAEQGVGPQGGRIPLATSLATLVLEKGEAGLLSDTELRPDLAFPQVGGRRARAIMSAPLRVSGEPCGALEVYASEPCEWSNARLSMLQWLAEQASRAWERVRTQDERRRDREELTRLNERLEDRVRERTAIAEHRAERLREMAAELTRAEHRERRRLAALLHDHLQQMLVAAKLHVGIIRRGEDGEAPREAASRVDDLLHQAIEISRSLTVELSPPILHEAGLAAGLEWLARSCWQKHELDVELDIEPALAVEDVDLRVFVYEAARELLFNVVKHANVRRARAAVRLDTGRLRLVVSDAGAGMATGGRIVPGESGFGLFSIQQRAELLGGELSVSSAPGQGTQVTLLLPLREPASRAEQPSMEITATDSGRLLKVGGGKIRVLVVDDHAVVRNGISSMLDSDPRIDVVGEAGDGVEAVSRALELRPDVIVMDVSMPRLDGIDATRQIAVQVPGSRVIGLSMYEHEDRGLAMLEAGAWDYLSKGAAGEELIARIHKVANAGARSFLPHTPSRRPVARVDASKPAGGTSRADEADLADAAEPEFLSPRS